MILFELKTSLLHKLFVFDDVINFVNYYQDNYYLNNEEKSILISLDIEKINSLLFYNVRKEIILEDGVDIECLGTGIIHTSTEIDLINNSNE
jgi:hypothetical protein